MCNQEVVWCMLIGSGITMIVFSTTTMGIFGRSSSSAFHQHALTWTKIASQLAPCCGNIHSESVFSCWVKVTNHHLRIIGGDSLDKTFHSPNLWGGLISYKVHREPSCLMEGEWGPADKGSSVAADPLHLHIAHLGSGSCAEKME